MCVALVALALPLARAAAAPDAHLTERAAAVLRRDAEDLRRIAAWGDANGLERTADADWERALTLAPDDPGTRKRLRWVHHDRAWVRDDASWAIARATPDAKPERAAEYEARRASEFTRPAAARHRELAVAFRAVGDATRADAELSTAVDRDPDDVWAHLALGDTLETDGEWVSQEVRRRRVAGSIAHAHVRRLAASPSAAVREAGTGSRSKAATGPLSQWRLREWRLETDLDDEAAALALETAELGARWFRDRFGIGFAEAVLPSLGRFVVVSSPETYARIVQAEAALSPGERKFALGLSAVPLPHSEDGDRVVVIERPDGVTAADACLHYAIHLLAQARFGVQAQEGWLYEGLAAYATLRLMSTQASWCVRIEDTSAGTSERAPHAESWAEDAASLAWSRADEPLRRLVGASLNELDGPMLVKAWSLLRWMLEEHPEEALAFLDARRSGLDSTKALKATTGLRLDDIDAAWRMHVLATRGE